MDDPKRRAWEAWVARGHIGPDGIVQSAWLHGYDAGAVEGVRGFVAAVRTRTDTPDNGEWLPFETCFDIEADALGLGRRGAEGGVGDG